ncbi:MAG: rRNA maturation RNase YbeY [Saprospiraceae bacterium]
MIRFHYSYPSFRIRSANKVKRWISNVASSEKKKIKHVEYIFVDDKTLRLMNQQSLHHDYYTDILTFAYAYNPIEGEMYISIDRIKDHATQYKVSTAQELYRVMVHGLLHLCGYDDQNKSNKDVMTRLEDKYLKLF